jgi:CIC family chloride channel protein
MAVVVGAGAGLGAVLFRYLILWFTELFTGHQDYSAAGHAINPNLPWLGIWFVVLVPVVGGLLYGPLIDRFAREARGHGVPEVMLAVAEQGGRIRPQVAGVKSLASALCIGAGGSVGREGPIVQIGSALGSTIGQAVRLPESRLRVLVACGAAGGISATFNAPIAGVFFALELILQDFATESFGVVVLASVMANVIGRAAFGSQAFLQLPAFHLQSYAEYPLYAVLGVVAAFVGIGFVRVLYGMEDLADRLWRGPEWLRPAVGGILLGLLLLALPEMYGVGYPVLENAINGHYVLWFLVILLVGKIVATSLTISIGGSGGVFAPSLFMGAMLGTAFGVVANHLFPGSTGPPGAYGLVGMGAVFAGAARAPITAVLIIFELTGEYRIILPLMFAIVVAAGISNLISKDTIYTLKLRRRGIDIMRGRSANLMEILTVADAMQPVPASVPPDLPLEGLVERLSEGGTGALPVVDEGGDYRGLVTTRQVEEAVRDNALGVQAGDLAIDSPTLSPSQTLHEALQVLARQDATGLPVQSGNRHGIAGWITHSDILRAYTGRLERSVASSSGPAPAGSPRDQSSTGPELTARPAAPPAVPSPLGDGETVARLEGYRVVDLELANDRALVGCRLDEVSWPGSSMLIAIRRDGRTLEPSDRLELRAGDRLSLLVKAVDADRIQDLLATLPGNQGGKPKADLDGTTRRPSSNRGP